MPQKKVPKTLKIKEKSKPKPKKKVPKTLKIKEAKPKPKKEVPMFPPSRKTHPRKAKTASLLGGKSATVPYDDLTKEERDIVELVKPLHRSLVGITARSWGWAQQITRKYRIERKKFEKGKAADIVALEPLRSRSGAYWIIRQWKKDFPKQLTSPHSFDTSEEEMVKRFVGPGYRDDLAKYK